MWFLYTLKYFSLQSISAVDLEVRVHSAEYEGCTKCRKAFRLCCEPILNLILQFRQWIFLAQWTQLQSKSAIWYCDAQWFWQIYPNVDGILKLLAIKPYKHMGTHSHMPVYLCTTVGDFVFKICGIKTPSPHFLALCEQMEDTRALVNGHILAPRGTSQVMNGTEQTGDG